MPRRFTRASSEKINQTLAAPAFTGLTFGTVACVVNRTTSGAAFHTICGNPNVANTDANLAMMFSTANLLDFYLNSLDNNSTFTVTNATGWVLVVANKATGTVLPRVHCYKWSTNSWTHENTTSTRANASGFNATFHIGLDCSALNDFFDGDIAAIMIVDKRSLTDSEIERLPRGLWEQVATGPTDVLREFSYNDRVGLGTNIDASKRRDAVLTGTTRSPLRGPPGFRFSAINRRC